MGHFLRNEAPLEYDLIIGIGGNLQPPLPELIESIGYASISPLFKKPKFRKALIEYRKYGLYAGPPRKCNAKTHLYYTKVRSTQAKLFSINKNVGYE